MEKNEPSRRTKMGLSLIIIQKTFMMFLLTLVGFICTKVGIIDTNTSKKLSVLALKLVTPMLIFSAYQMEYDVRILKNLGLSFGLCLIANAVQITLAFLLARKKADGDTRYRLERLCIIFSNCGFFGIPLINSLYGEEGVIYLTAFVTVFNVLIWVLGVPILIGKTSAKDTLKNILSPSTIAAVLGFACLILQIKVPTLILEPIEMIGNMNTPFAMIAAGASIAGTKWAAGLKNPRFYYITVCKLLLVPAVTVLLFSLFPFDSMLIMIPILAVACPVAAACPMLSALYDHDTNYASQLFAVTTVLSIGTIPLIYLFSVALGI